MKRNSFVLALALVLVSAASQAQVGFNFGPRVGLNFSSLTLSSANGVSVDGKAGFVGGLFARVEITRFTIQPELVYAIRNGSGAQGTTSFNIRTSSFDVPLLVGYKFLDAKVVKARILAGPVFSFNTSNDVSLGQVLDFPSNYVTAWQAGVAVDVWKLIVDLRYEGALKNQLTDQTGRGVKLNQFQFGVAYKIL